MTLHLYHHTGLYKYFFVCWEEKDGGKQLKVNKRTNRIIML